MNLAKPLSLVFLALIVLVCALSQSVAVSSALAVTVERKVVPVVLYWTWMALMLALNAFLILCLYLSFRQLGGGI